ncbi:hypothetical protein EVAR_43081_1 [Eumeta japonica]|uniref:Uncharacterized protein n=1 Tax=Eumeta variegata TaxID=151549 RepID=A0A4C1WUW1_EUMVA|nr:hypothetical protein EVAR_43081_1 [Eumeta japonica]
MSHRTREARRMPALSHSTMIGLPRALARELVHSLQMYCKLLYMNMNVRPVLNGEHSLATRDQRWTVALDLGTQTDSVKTIRSVA